MLDCRRGHKPPKRSGITKCRNREQSAKTLPEHLGEAELVSRFHCPGSLSLAPQTRMAHRAPLLRSTIWVLEPGTRGRVTHRDDAAALEGPFLGQGASTHQRPEVGQNGHWARLAAGAVMPQAAVVESRPCSPGSICRPIPGFVDSRIGALAQGRKSSRVAKNGGKTLVHHHSRIR